ncbi:MAG: PD-(D/E)XK nuclease family protein [Actinobacteria bacterium]|nr:MAG: PD-(D/E)XK nuclease family protein [Actinomycetota bacterium]
MGLTIVTGAANAGKTGILHAAVRAAVVQGLDSALLLPSGPEVLRAEQEFAQEGSALGVTIAQFDRYLSALWGLLGDGRMIAQSTQRVLAVGEALSRVRLRVLARSAARPGFARLLESLVQRAGESLALDGARAKGATNDAAREILELVDAYAGILREGDLVESAEAHRLLTEAVTRDDLPQLLAINRFASFTPAQKHFIIRASQLGCDVRVAQTWVDGHPATYAASADVAELEAIDGAKHIHVAGSSGENVELRAVAEGLFGGIGEIKHPEPTGAVSLSEAAGTAGEAARITREIQEMVISGKPYRDIAVVFRNPERHHARLSAAFREAGVPAEFDVRVCVASTGLGRALLLLLGYFNGGQDRAELTGFLRSGYAWADPAAVDAADESLRRRRIGHGRQVLEAVKGAGGHTRVLLERAERLAAAPVDGRSIEGWRWLVADMLRSAHGPVAVFDAQGLVDAAAQSTVMAAIEEIAALGSGSWGAREVAEALKNARVTVAPPETGGDHVHVMSAERARSRRFPVVILGGLNAGEFPAVPADDALSSPLLAAELLAAGIDAAPRIDADDERLLFYQIVTGARERLILSRMVCDDDGQPVRASSLWEEFLDLYRDPVTGEPYSGRLPVRHLELSDLAESEDAPIAERRLLRAAALAGDTSNPRTRYATYRAQSRRGCVSEQLAAELAEVDTFSASDIERYLACPFGWFYERRLRPDPLEAEIDVLQKGSLAHEILQRFYERREELGQGRVSSGNLEHALEQHEVIASEVLASGPTPASLHDEEMLHAAKVGSRRIVERDAVFLPGFEPIAHELRFHTKNDQPSVKVGSFFLKGRIDRVDASDAGIIIIDYKSGSTVAKRTDLASKGLVQLPLYGLVAAEALQKPLLGGLYRSMHYGGDRGFLAPVMAGTQGLFGNDVCDVEGFDQVISTAVSLAEQAVEGMRAGIITAHPREKSACTFCGAATVCRGGVR